MFRYFLILVLFFTWTYGAPRAYKKNSSIRNKDISYKILKRAQTVYNETHSVQSQTGFFNNSQTTQSTLDTCSGRCSPNGYCWGKRCYCDSGYVGDGFICEKNCSDRCHPNAICYETTCQCKYGYEGDGIINCNDACSGRCSPNGYCWGKRCYCYYGYVGDGFTCETQTTSTQSTLAQTTSTQSTLDSCTSDYECQANAYCDRASGSCECFPDFIGDGKMCNFDCSSCLYPSMCDGSRCYDFGTTTETIEVETTQTATTTATTEEGSEIALSLNKIDKDLVKLTQSVERIVEHFEKL